MVLIVVVGLVFEGGSGFLVWVGVWLFFFFFQAEDGIRDLTVTGVQTCALPIWSRLRRCVEQAFRPRFDRVDSNDAADQPPHVRRRCTSQSCRLHSAGEWHCCWPDRKSVV